MEILQSFQLSSLPKLNEWILLTCLVFLCFLSLGCYFKKQSQAIDYWLFLGTLPSILLNSTRFPEWATEVFSSSLGSSGSFFVDGPIFSKLRYFVTCHPQNIEYILRTNFNNFPKGPGFKEIFDLLGDGIFNIDSDPWRIQRRMAHAAFASGTFKTLVANMSFKVVKEHLVPFLVHAAENGSTIDLQDVCSRFALDCNICTIFGRHEKSLSIDLPYNEFGEAAENAQVAQLYRHTMPTFLWKLLRFFNVGRERKLSKAQITLDIIIQNYISQKKEDLRDGVQSVDLLSYYVKSNEEMSISDDKSLRDTMLNLFLAGKDTIASGLIWFFWLVSKTPSVEMKILEELKLLLCSKNITEDEMESKWPWVFESGDLKGLVYLQASLCESLRLYPPLPMNSKSVIEEDVLPDGTLVKPGMQVILSFYSAGRMPWIWGEDCLEFKPSRWLDDHGKLSFKALAKFFTFNAGPRSCIGKDMSFTQMKSAAAAVLFNFHIEVVQGHHVCLKPFINLQMKNGLNVKLKKRSMKS